MQSPAFPTLDIGALRGTHQQRLQFARELGSALREFGFVSVVGHDVDPALRARAYAATRALFALPTAAKLAYHEVGGGGERGYTPFRIETAKGQTDPDLKEFWHVGRELTEANPASARLKPNVWPAALPEFREVMTALYARLDALGGSLLEAIAIHLELPDDWFADKIDHGNSILRPIHYPPLEAGVRGVRSAAHEDINLITLLIGSGEPGLEILRPDGTWLPIDTPEDRIVVNVGDMLQRLTNHVLPSTTHRVVNPPEPWGSRARYSLPFFLHFNPEFVIDTLPGCVSATRENRYPRPITADEYLQERLREIGLK
jgi:isopenicillin N synthase-like dioxygenase